MGLIKNYLKRQGTIREMVGTIDSAYSKLDWQLGRRDGKQVASSYTLLNPCYQTNASVEKLVMLVGLVRKLKH